MKWDEWRGSLDGRPTMWIKRLGKMLGCRLDLHKFVRADDRDCFHTHPAWAIRAILWGGYIEQLWQGEPRIWSPGSIGIVRPQHCHRVDALLGKASYSLWLRGPVVAKVERRGRGWQGQRWHCPRCDAEGDYNELVEGEACPHCRLVL